MTQVVIGVEVYCSNPRCPILRIKGSPRFIGEDGGGGGRWQCKDCREWTRRTSRA